MSAVQQEKIEGALEVVYCPRCGYPPEYCEFRKDFAKCKPWIMENMPHLYAEADDADGAADGVAKLSVKGDDEKKQDDGGKDAKKQKEKKKVGFGKSTRFVKKPEVVLTNVRRSKRKSTTSVEGMELFGHKLKDVAKKFSKRFACSCAVVKVPGGGKEVQMQGDMVYDAAEYIVKEYNIPQDKVFQRDKNDRKIPVQFYDDWSSSGEEEEESD
eukprot:TRINITY_DN12527_c0_g1_i1.p1 TRINITY_DN12527_c0_g1~~TRINITY_DN12527_c0_g1_i1.p1  ORF type:complete len:239 (-),score=121.39 TRINITY_DN12527_c0_g1_i1:50-688(-)